MSGAWQEQIERMDEASGFFLVSELEAIRPKMVRKVFAELIARELIPVDHSLSSGTEWVTIRTFEPLGLAKIISNYAEDIPRADVVASEVSVRIKGIATSYGFSIQEARAAQEAGRPLDIEKANSAKQATEQQIDLLGRVGNLAHGLYGVLNNPNVTEYTLPNDGTGASTRLSLKSPDQILRDLNGMVYAVVDLTNGYEKPDTVLMPERLYGYLASTPRSANSDTTLLTYFTNNNPHIKSVVPWAFLKGAGAAGTDRMLVYKRDPECLELIIPQEFEQFAPQQEKLEAVTYCHARCGGVQFKRPLSATYADGC